MGRYSLLLPSRDGALEVQDLRSLEQHSPDIIIRWTDDVKDGYLEELRDRTGALGTGAYDPVSQKAQQRHGHPFGGVDMASVVDHLARHNRPPDPSNLRLVNATGHQGYQRALRYVWGLLPATYNELYAHALNAPIVNCQPDDLASYLETLRALRGRASPIGMTTHYGVTAVGGATRLSGLILVVTNRDCAFDDASLFWNLRTQTGWLRNPSPQLIPWTENDDVAALGRWVAECESRQKFITLASRTLGIQALKDLRDRLHAVLPERIERVNIWHDQFEHGPVETTSQYRSLHELRIQDRTTEIITEQLPFADRQDLWITAVPRSPFRISHPFDDFQWPTFPGMNAVIGPDLRGGASGGIYHVPYYVRLDGDQIAYFSMARAPRAQLRIPEPAEMARAFLRSQGVRAEVTSDKGRYATQLLRLAGGVSQIPLLLDPLPVQLLWQMRDLRAYTMDQCLGAFHAGRSGTEKMLSDLLARRLLRPGYELRCPVCDVRDWYPLAAVDERFSCTGCLSIVELPLDARIAYRLNALAATAIQQGTLGVLGGVHLLQLAAATTVTFQPGIDLPDLGTEGTDIDVLASIDGAVCAMECKTLLDGADQRTARQIIDQFDRLHTALKDTAVGILMLYILAPEIPEPLQTAWTQRMSQRQHALPVALVSSATCPQRRGGLPAKQRRVDPGTSRPTGPTRSRMTR